MKITAQEEYGLRCLLQLAHAPEGQLTTVKEVAKQEGLSDAYVEKLLRLLGRAGLVHSVRGMKGGYTLNRPASQITLGEVVRCLGGMETTEHICQEHTGQQDICVHFNDCGVRSVWAGMTTYIRRYLDQTTLDLLLENEYTVSARLENRLHEGSFNV